MALNYEAAFIQSPAPCMILNQRLEFVAANPAYLALVGRSEHDLIGKYVFDAFPESQERVSSMNAVFQDTLDGKPTAFYEVPFRVDFDGVIKEQFWTARHAVLDGNEDGEKYIMQCSENVTEQVKARDMQDALTGELQHRVGNIFSIIGAIARQTGRITDSIPDFLDRFEHRISSLVKVNRQLTGDHTSDQTLAAVVQHQLSVHTEDAKQRMMIDGPAFPLSGVQAQAVSMAIHELGTNSLKYGAISQPDATLSITWELKPGNRCVLRWRETGIVPQDTARRTGYGSLLLNRIIPRQIEGAATSELGDDSFVYTLEIGTAG